MSTNERQRLTLEPIGDDPEVGRWLAALEDGRRDTLRELEQVTPGMVDWYPDAPLNSIGALLYHIALIEADWVVTEILELDAYPADLQRSCPGRTAMTMAIYGAWTVRSCTRIWHDCGAFGSSSSNGCAA